MEMRSTLTVMKVIIAGGRDYYLSDEDRDTLDYLFFLQTEEPRTCFEIVTGMARGADREGDAWAVSRFLKVYRFPALWDAYGKSAGFRRNADMAKFADGLAVFPGGKGTQHMIALAIKEGLKIWNLTDQRIGKLTPIITRDYIVMTL